MAGYDQARALAGVADDLINLWLYQQRLKGAGLEQIRAMAMQPGPVVTRFGLYDEGVGLDRDMSISQISRRIKGVQTERRDRLSDMAGLFVAAELDKLDAREAIVNAQIQRLLRSTARASELNALDVHGEKALQSADARLAAIAERRAKLLGLDAPTQVEHSGSLEVSNASAELAALIDQAAERAERDRLKVTK